MNPTIVGLAREIDSLKSVIADAQEKIEAAREKILEVSGFGDRIGSLSLTESDGEWEASIGISRQVSRDVVQEEIPSLKKTLTRSEFSKVFRLRYMVNARALEDFEKVSPEKARLVSESIVVTPKKTTVTIKDIVELDGTVTRVD